MNLWKSYNLTLEKVNNITKRYCYLIELTFSTLNTENAQKISSCIIQKLSLPIFTADRISKGVKKTKQKGIWNKFAKSIFPLGKEIFCYGIIQ